MGLMANFVPECNIKTSQKEYVKGKPYSITEKVFGEIGMFSDIGKMAELKMLTKNAFQIRNEGCKQNRRQFKGKLCDVKCFEVVKEEINGGNIK